MYNADWQTCSQVLKVQVQVQVLILQVQVEVTKITA